MFRVIFKWAGIVALFLLGGAMLLALMAALGFDGWKKIGSLWDNIGWVIASATYAVYAYVAFNWKSLCHWLASKVADDDVAIELGEKLQEKKVLAISIVIFVEAVSWSSRLSA